MLVWHGCAFDPQREIALTEMSWQLTARRCRRAVLASEPLLWSAGDADGAKMSFLYYDTYFLVSPGSFAGPCAEKNCVGWITYAPKS
jgi:hypothetical protein